MALPTIFSPSENCWRTERADDFSILIDANDYFSSIRASMMAAKRSIFFVGWDFDASITLGHPKVDDGAPRGVGDFLLWLARRTPGLEIRILLWSPAPLASWARLSNLPYLLRWKWNRQISVRLDGKHPFGSSHHQKMLVIDDAVAYCGGIDVTLDRWDTRQHLDDDPDRRRPNGTPYGPWHDISSRFTGPAARALGELCRNRWTRAGGEEVPLVAAVPPLLDTTPSFSFGTVDLAIARTSPAYQEENLVTEIEQLYIDMINAARHTVYAESQYFASRVVAQAIARRLAEPDGPEFVLINPTASDNWLGQIAMDTARARLVEALRRHDIHGRFRVYHPVTASGQPIYVHAKLMIIDETCLRVGSSNMNNRSMRFDRECDVALEAGGSEQVSLRIAAFRNDLLAEHLDTTPKAVEEAIRERGSLLAAIEMVRAKNAESGRATLKPYETPDISDIEKWLADNEILDPEGADAVFEPIEKRGLFRGRLKRPRRRKAIR
ncbi:phospholipase D-like domain-containing protein [Rhizobium wuzhouense]|uniref:Phospholipase D n=1 Tax=Rhizobium wuzhouense TaxID=1986026 RepID=A0ABX5NRG5_9HYPH|nr:phospholipase D-like domain-containing protein [Rhizobium wuzhouense]PYB70662.1 phospholipase [Rhizobium wuzhouense]